MTDKKKTTPNPTPSVEDTFRVNKDFIHRHAFTGQVLDRNTLIVISRVIGAFTWGDNEIVKGGDGKGEHLLPDGTRGKGQKTVYRVPSSSDLKKLYDSGPEWILKILPPKGYKAPWEKN